jgi:hypothetical protein
VSTDRAPCFGACDSTRRLLGQLSRAGVSVSSLEDCEGAQAALEDRLRRASDDAEALLESELAAMEAALGERATKTRARARGALERVRRRKASASMALRAARGASPLEAAGHRARAMVSRVVAEAELLVEQQVELVARKRQAAHQRRLEDLRAQPEAWLASERERLAAQLAALRDAVRSDLFAGAVGEEMVAHRLRGLDGRHRVYHDLSLDLPTPITMFERRRFTAQLDHAVVGPGGVFALETKNWSASTAQAPHIHDPYEQVATAAQFLRILLRDQGVEAPVRACLVAVGRLPPKRPDTWVTVLRPDDLVGHISGSRTRLEEPRIREVAAVLLTSTRR